MNTGCRLLSVFAFLGVAVAPLSASAQQERPKGPPSASEMWVATCASCHGENGGGLKGKAKSLLTDAAMDEATDRPFFELLRKADGPHGGDAAIMAMTEQQTWALIVHLREMQTDDWRKRVGDPKPDKAGIYSSRRAKFSVETVISKAGGRDLKTPWSIEWLPQPETDRSRPGDAQAPAVVVTEKDGTLWAFDRNFQTKGEIGGLPKLISRGQGGLMDAAAHPDYAKNGWLYLTFAEPSEDGKREMTKVVRGKLTRGKEAANQSPTEGWRFTEQEVIFQPRKNNYNGPGVHYGARIVFQKPTGDDAKEANGRWLVYFSIGERGGMEQAQAHDRPNGKIHRVWDDGAIPSTNPFAKEQGNAYPSIWSVGHRNQQGLCFDDAGNLWDTEHGPRGGDELNLIRSGGNYGWPQACFGINYSDQPFVTPWKETATDGTPLTVPVHRWIRSIAACGLDCARAVDIKQTFPGWSGDLFAGGLAGQTVQRLRIKDGRLIEQEEIVHGMGRIRDVAFGPDGLLYLVLNDPNKVVRLVPAK